MSNEIPQHLLPFGFQIGVFLAAWLGSLVVFGVPILIGWAISRWRQSRRARL
ncbi:MAG TPA: hypothetical protein VJA21_09680 [Verrucomicrobiae bacterium]